MAERSQKEVWRLAPWLMIALLLFNFILMAFDAKTGSQERVVRIWALVAADFVQSPVTTVSSSVNNYFQSISSMRTAQSENDILKQRIQELEVEVKQKEDLTSESARLRSLLELKEQAPYKILPDQIIGRYPSAWFDASTINR